MASYTRINASALGYGTLARLANSASNACIKFVEMSTGLRVEPLEVLDESVAIWTIPDWL